MKQKDIDNAEILWNYHKVDQIVTKSDLIFGLGSIDLSTADRCAELFLQKFSKQILFSGGVAHKDDLLRTTWNEPEAVVFKKRAIELGVPSKYILTEQEATNTGENITLGYKLLQEKDIKVNSIILVQKPYMLRRTYATFKKQWPDKDTKFLVTCINTTFVDYVLNNNKTDLIVNLMVGDLQRIIEYPKKGFQIEQEVPNEVLKAYESLIKSGYTEHLIK